MDFAILQTVMLCLAIVSMIAAYIVGLADMTYNKPEGKKLSFILLQWELFFYCFDFKKDSTYKMRSIYRALNLLALLLIIIPYLYFKMV